MKHFNLTNNDPVNKIIMSITNVNQLNSLRKVGNYGITSKIPINGSKNFSIELLTVSVNGNLIMRQTTGDLYCRTSNGVFGRIAAPTVASTLKHSGIVGSLPYWVAD